MIASEKSLNHQQKNTPAFQRRRFYDRVYKPGSVIDSHLSRRTVAGALQPPSRKQPGKPCFLCGVAPDRVYSNGHFYAPLGELLPRLSILTASGGPLTAVFLCCTFPQIALGGRYPLSLPCGARTFLMRGLSALRPRLSDPVAEVLYFICRKKSNGLQFLSRADIIQTGNDKRGFWI